MTVLKRVMVWLQNLYLMPIFIIIWQWWHRSGHYQLL